MECDVASDLRWSDRQRCDWRGTRTVGRRELRRDLGRARQVAVLIADRRNVASNHRREPHRSLPRFPGGRACAVRERRRRDRQYQFRLGDRGRGGCERLLREQSRRHRADAGDVARPRARGNSRLCRRTRGYRYCPLARGRRGQRKSLPKVTPLGAGEPGDVASAVAFLLSNEARFISGATIVVDGALMAY